VKNLDKARWGWKLSNGFAFQLRHPDAAAFHEHVGPRCSRWQLASCRQLL